MKLTSKGRVTISVAIRENAGLILLDGDAVRICKARASTRETRGQEIVRRLRGSAIHEDVDQRDHGLDSWRGLIPFS